MPLNHHQVRLYATKVVSYETRDERQASSTTASFGVNSVECLTATLTDSPLTDKDMSLQIPKLPWPNTISLLLSLTTDS